MRHIFRILMLCLLGLQMTALNLRAESAGPCAAELTKFCGQVKPGGGRVVTCLLEHEQESSPTCREHLAELKWKIRKEFPECRDDVEKFCMQVRAQDRRIIRCLLQNREALSYECRDKLKEAK